MKTPFRLILFKLMQNKIKTTNTLFLSTKNRHHLPCQFYSNSAMINLGLETETCLVACGDYENDFRPAGNFC